MSDPTRDELVAMRDRLNALIGEDEAPAEAVFTSVPEPKRPVETFIMVDGSPQPASMQPSQSDLQGAFTMGGTKAKPRIVIDMALALPIAQDMVRHARQAAFARNDSARALAADLEDDAAIKAVRKKAAALRDAPADARLTDATTPDAILAAVDAIIAEF